jgi:hypothetical protein
MGQCGGEQIIMNKLIGPPVIPSTGISKWVTIVEYISAADRVLKPIVIHIRKEPKDYWFPSSYTAPD